ncbi:hypothetical protein JOD63_001659 [Microbacterium terrae]|uniref:Uncharacterized protein n=1 Tax=Microbacterium terrae TaxID=69369 RepID=A0A0M2H5E8_9MICO|nr:hypothetical protein [Microbacterium terrae]KJL39154.1 hypothetical protein RS81_02248 [Microbacterium terrae]MBP1077691.1 hypothetical protein [Microbacterium terrae]GLJ99858.1 hypothetical protein GCM10017594_30560 [Microbacterium terrae]
MDEELDAATDPRQMLDLLEKTRRETIRRMTGRYAGLVVLWAVAWGIGFSALWLTTGVGGVDLLPTATGWWIFGGSLAVAIVWSAFVGIRAAGDGIRGRSQLQGALYGCSWTIVMIAAALFIWALQRNGLPHDMEQLIWPGLYIFLVGVLYLAGGALWRAVPMYILGGVLIVIVIVATFFGAPTHFLVYAIAGPVAMLAVAALMYWGPIEAYSPETPSVQS